MTSRRLVKLALLLVLVALVAAIWFSPLRAHLNAKEIRAFVAGMRGAWYAPIVFMITYAAAAVLGIPATLFVVTAGVVWGWKLGSAYAILGGTLGATASYFVGRFLGEGILERFGKVGRMVTKQVDHAGFRSLLILRLIPIFPFAVINYGAGVARARLRDYVPATAIGLAPSALVFTYCADALFSGTMSEGDVLERLLVVLALVLALVLLPLVLKKFVRTPVVEER
jgi:uncharacterized membrane protein YdjX (TVP38/TMEM64 family)